MLCIARVALPDQALDEVRDVDPQEERIQGLLRAGFLVPMVRRAMPEAEKPVESTITFKVEPAPDSKPRASRRRAVE